MRFLTLLGFMILWTIPSAAQSDRNARMDLPDHHFGDSQKMQIASGNQTARCLLSSRQWDEETGDPQSPAAQSRRKQMLATTAQENGLDEYYSDSGKFRILFTTEGPDSIPATYEMDPESLVPDYVLQTAFYADSSYRYQVLTLGFVDPTMHQEEKECVNRDSSGEWQDTVITIRYQDFENYGSFNRETPFEFTVNNNFDGFPQNQDSISNRLGALKVTIAHEFKHTIQYATNCMSGDAGANAWVEMDATMMENIVHPNVNDYYNYIKNSTSIFNKPENPVPVYYPPNNNDIWYNQVTWLLFFAEYYGMDFWVDAWTYIQLDHNLPFLAAMENALFERGDTFESALIRNHLWHFASGGRSLESYGFQEREEYPNANARESYDSLPDVPGDEVLIPGRAATYTEFNAAEIIDDGIVALSFFSDSLNAGVGLLVKKTSGEIQEIVIPSTLGTPQNWKLAENENWVNWVDVQWLGVVRVSAARNILRNELFAGVGPNVEKLIYGDVNGSGQPSTIDARWMLEQRLQPERITASERFLRDVSGNGRIGQYDAALVYRQLADPDNPAHVFPVDENGDGKGPEWSSFVEVGAVNTILAKQTSAINSFSDGDVLFRELNITDDEIYSKRGSAWGSSDVIQSHEEPTVESVTAHLHVTKEHINVDDIMELVVSVQGGKDTLWNSIYLELDITYPNPDGSTGNPIQMDFLSIKNHNEMQQLQGWVYDIGPEKLRLAYASSEPFARSDEIDPDNPDPILSIRMIPYDDGYMHFRVDTLEFDELMYAVNHPLMNTIRVNGPVNTEDPGDKPLVFELSQNYPNPFNPETNISFSLPKTAPVRLQVFDITGRLIVTLVDETMTKGVYSVRFDTRVQHQMSSGVYLYRLEAGGQTFVRKMSILK